MIATAPVARGGALDEGRPHPGHSLYTALQKRLVLVGGKGGVGKTTLAAALALALARLHPERKIILLSTDPAHCLLNALGGPKAQASLPPNVEVRELDAPAAFKEFRTRHREGLRKIALRGTFMDEEDLHGLLDQSLPGADELAVLQAIAQTVEERHADHLLVDTAPTGHTLRLLALPNLVDQWRGALDAMLGKHRVMAKLYAGRYVEDEADALINELDQIASRARALLCDAKASVFLPVMNADPLCLWETRRLLEALGRLGLTVPCVIVNRVSERNSACERCLERRRQEAVYIHQAEELFGRELVTVPCLPVEPLGVARLEALGEVVLGRRAGSPPDDTPVAPVGRAAGHRTNSLVRPADLRRALAAHRMFLVCGKGGVGKTTVASALALWLAELDSKRVLLFSLDPAHSLSDAFARPIGEKPVAVAGRLEAVEINPEERLRRFRESYREEIEEFFDVLVSSDQVDASLDREAAERLVDLSPPGLDEVMALAELARYLRLGRYGRFVLDTAPTGHFLQFLELPEVIRGWIRAFFEIFLKYGKFLRAPKLRTYLVDLSKAIKEVQAALHGALLLPVVIPNELSFQQMREFLPHVERLGHSARVGVINHVTAVGNGCAECARRAETSWNFQERYRQLHAGLAFLFLEEQPQSPTGVAQLSHIGRALFG